MSRVSYGAIPTVFDGVQYRSRLEARFACLFCVYGYAFDYEPLDLKGYCPDFLVDLPGLTVLWECKPAVTRQEFRPAERRITRSGWVGPAVISGSRLSLAPDDRADLTLVGATAAESGGFSPVGRARWPRSWGEYPFADVMRVWAECGNRVQWKSPA